MNEEKELVKHSCVSGLEYYSNADHVKEMVKYFVWASCDSWKQYEATIKKFASNPGNLYCDVDRVKAVFGNLRRNLTELENFLADYGLYTDEGFQATRSQTLSNLRATHSDEMGVGHKVLTSSLRGE